MSAVESMSGFDCFGTDELPKQHRPISLSGTALALAAGTIGSVVWRSHPVLGFLGAAAIASNTQAVVKKERTWKDAAKRLGRHVVATAGALALPAYPAVGYVAAAIAADLFLDGEGGGIIEEWTRYEGVEDAQVIDVTPIKPDNKTTALVKT